VDQNDSGGSSTGRDRRFIREISLERVVARLGVTRRDNARNNDLFEDRGTDYCLFELTR